MSNCARCNKCNTQPLNESYGSNYSWTPPGGVLNCPDSCSDTGNSGRFTPNLNLIKPRPTDRICLSDWNHNMDVIDAYYGNIFKKFECLCDKYDKLVEEVTSMSAGKVFRDIPSDITTTDISTKDLCASILTSEEIEATKLYTGVCTLTDGPADSVQLTIRVINKTDIYLYANSATVAPYEWFYHYYKNGDDEYISDEWLPITNKASSSAFGMVKLSDDFSINDEGAIILS